MNDYYKILGVDATASVAEIKRAYRQKAKAIHPDTASGKDSAEFHALACAYKTLSDAHQRALFDLSFQTRREFKRSTPDFFDYRIWLSSRTDEESRSKLVILDLMRDREDEAVAEYKRLTLANANFSLARYFVREDFMDYGFILSEELVLRGEYYDAAILLEQIILMEKNFAYFKHFFPEVIMFARDIFLRKIEGAVNDELALDTWERALELGFGKNDDAVFLLKMAQAYDRLGDAQMARRCAEESAHIKAAPHFQAYARQTELAQ